MLRKSDRLWRLTVLARATIRAQSGPPLAIVTALSSEAATLQRYPGVAINTSGMGADNAQRCAQDAIGRGAQALVCWGFAGGLHPDLAPGALLLPAAVRDEDGSTLTVHSPWQQRLCRVLAGAEPNTRPLQSVAEPLRSRAEKLAAARTGAVACDMESAAILKTAAAHGRPAVVIRVVLDTATDELPSAIDGLVDSNGQLDYRRLAGVVWKPSLWRAISRLMGRYTAARRTLRAAAGELDLADFGRGVLTGE